MTRSLKKGSKRQLPHIINGSVTLKASGFADQLFEQFSPNPSLNRTKKQRIDRTVQIFRSVPFTDLDIPIIGFDEVKGIVSGLIVRKALCLDDLPNAAITRAPDRTLSAITNIANAIIQSGHCPSDWNVAKVILIKKKGERATNIDSYRPIRLLCNLEKIIEHVS